MSEPCRCYGGAAPTLHPTPQVQEGLRGMGGHTLDPQALLLIFPQGLVEGWGGPGWGMMGTASAFLSVQRQRPRCERMKLMRLRILTIHQQQVILSVFYTEAKHLQRDSHAPSYLSLMTTFQVGVIPTLQLRKWRLKEVRSLRG